MKKCVLPLLLAGALAAPAWSQTEVPVPDQTPLAADVSETQEKVVVVGQRPGPGLWKVSKGDNVLWVFGTYGPLPPKVQWRSHEVQAILARSQEVLSPPSAKPKLGVFQMAKMVPHAFGLQKNPDGKTLKDVLPPDVYARWETMRQQYLGDKNYERERPFFVAERLYGAGLRKAGLSSKGEVSGQIAKMVEQSKVKLTKIEIEFEVDDPSALLKSFKRTSMDDAACLSSTMDRIEQDIEVLKMRADAWTKGDVAEIRKLNFTDREGACKGALFNTAVFKEGMKIEETEARLRAAWLAAAEKALATNASTFAVLSMKHMIEPTGMIAALQAKGYQVDSPE